MRGKIVLVPIGPVDEEVLSVVGEGLATALGREWGIVQRPKRGLSSAWSLQ